MLKKVLFLAISLFLYSSCDLFVEEDVKKVTVKNLVASTNQINDISLSWDDPYDYDIESYNIYRSDSEDGKFEYLGNSTSCYYIDYDLGPNKTFYYYVKSVYDKGKGDRSNIAKGYSSFISPKLTINPTLTQLKFSWEAQPGVEYYNLYTYDYWEKTYTIFKEKIIGDSYIYTPPDSNSQYYAITSVVGGVESEYSDYVSSSLSSIEAVKNVSTTANYTEVTLSWDKVNGATKYKVSHSTSSSFYGGVESFYTTDLTFVHTTPSYTKTNYYRVYAIKSNGDVGGYNETASMWFGPLPKATNLSGIYTSSDFTLTWTGVSGISKYNVYRGLNSSGSDAILIDTITDVNSFSESTTGWGTDYYYYFITTSIGVRESRFSSNYSYNHLGKGEISKVEEVSNGIKVSWNKSNYSSAVKIYIYRSDSLNGSYSQIKEVSGSSGYFIDTGVTGLGPYFYKISSFYNSVESELSDPVELTLTGVTLGLKATDGTIESGIDIAWEQNMWAENYEIHYSTEFNGTYTLLDTVSKSTTSYHHPEATKGKTYYYKVRALSSSGTPYEFSTYDRGVTFGRAPSLRVTNSWSPQQIEIITVPGAKSYKIEIYEMIGTVRKGVMSRKGKDYITGSDINTILTFDSSAYGIAMVGFKVTGYFNNNATGTTTYSSGIIEP